MVRGRLPPGQWRTFLRRHASAVLAVDFTTVPLWNFVQLYIFVVIAPDTRQVLAAKVTQHPTLSWVKWVLGAVLARCRGRTLVLHDNDGIYGQFGRARVVDGKR